MKKSFATLINLLISVSVFSQIPWFLTGNANTTTYNFVSTTDNPLILRVNNQWAGFTGYQDKGNVSFGYSPSSPLNAGIYNTAFGLQALQRNSIGTLALRNNRQNHTLIGNTTGVYNTAVGVWSLVPNIIGSYKMTIGTKSLFSNMIGGYYNSGIGVHALELNTTSYWNVALGSDALNKNTTGHSNTAGENSSMLFNTTDVESTALGEQSLEGSLEGSFNTALGYRALWPVCIFILCMWMTHWWTQKK